MILNCKSYFRGLIKKLFPLSVSTDVTSQICG